MLSVNRYEYATNSSSYLNSVKVTVLDLTQILNRNPEKVVMAQDPVPPQIKNPVRVVLAQALARILIKNLARMATAQDPVPPQIKNPMRVVLDLDRTRIQNPARVALDPT
jgi:hypothetical protein